MISLLTNVFCVVAVILIWIQYDRKLILERRASKQLREELDAIVERLYGSQENYELSKRNERECRTDREQKVAMECAEKGIPRTAKQYPARFRGTR